MKTQNLYHYKRIIYVLAIPVFFVFSSCMEDFLDAKPNRSLAVPKTLADLDAILKHDDLFCFNAPFLQEFSADDFLFEDNSLRSANVTVRSSYLWADDFYEDYSISTAEWSRNYEVVYNANVVLDLLGGIDRTMENATEWDQIRGTALFFRGLGHFVIAQLFAEQYDADHAQNKLGIPLRLTSNINDRPGRGTLKGTYDQIIMDLETAEELVPLRLTTKKSSPDRAAVRAMLARVYLTMEDYGQALHYSELGLALNDQLMDYNTFDPASPRPIPSGYYPYDPANVEVLLFLRQINYGMNTINARTVFIAPDLMASYDEDDLRRRYYFQHVKDGLYVFVGNYNGMQHWFSGLTTAELYLIRMECNARLGNYTSAIADFNQLRSKRIRNSGFSTFYMTDPDRILEAIIEERRRELVTRGIRWSDLRRLNRDERFAKTIIHRYLDRDYVLEPNSKKYIFPIHPVELSLTGIIDNVR